MNIIEPIKDIANSTELAQTLATEKNMFANVGCAKELNEEPAPAKYLVDGLIEEELVAVLTGMGAVGKSLLSMQLAGCVATGLPFLGRPVQEGPVLYLSIEERRRKFHQRLHQMMYGLLDIHLKNGGERETFQLIREKLAYYLTNKTLEDIPTALTLKENMKFTKHLARFREIVKPKLIVLDPLVYFLDDENDNGEAKEAYNYLLRELAVDGTTVLLNHHVGKAAMNGVGSSQASPRGASHIVLGAKFAANIEKSDSCRKLVITKDNYRDESAPGEINLDLKGSALINDSRRPLGWYWHDEVEVIEAARKKREEADKKCNYGYGLNEVPDPFSA